MKTVLVLGAGLMGHWIARFLGENSRNYVVVCDNDRQKLAHTSRHGIHTCALDFRKDTAQLQHLAQESDIVVGAMPGNHIAFEANEAVLRTGTPIVDISFYTESPALLGSVALEAGTSYVPHMGIDPGLNRLMLGKELANVESISEFITYAGGLPHPESGRDYMAVFAPESVLDEYTRPVVVVKDGKVLTCNAMSGYHSKKIPAGNHILELEAFRTNNLCGAENLRSVVPDMATYTLRYPGHRKRIRELAESGAFKNEKRADALKQLEEEWRFGPDDRDILAMQVHVRGEKRGPRTVVYTVYTERRGTSADDPPAMAQATGLPCAAMAESILEKPLPAGVAPPEQIGQDTDRFRKVIKYCRDRGMSIKREEKIA